ncbi:MAG: dethiobiotin synthase [Chitinophagales bacterium]
MDRKIFITGIGTGIGKTISSAVLCEAWQADYWKPVQAGDLDATDRMKVAELISNEKTVAHPEQFLLKEPAAPYMASRKEGFEIQQEDFQFPSTSNKLLIEGAGGLFVPINPHYFFIDFIVDHQLPVVLVVSPYLGAINHTLLSLEALQKRSIPVKGLILNGNNEAAAFIADATKIPVLLELPQTENLNKNWVKQQAQKVNPLNF